MKLDLAGLPGAGHTPAALAAGVCAINKQTALLTGGSLFGGIVFTALAEWLIKRRL